MDEIIIGNIECPSIEHAADIAATAVYVDNSDELEDGNLSNDELLEDLAVMEYVAEDWLDSMGENEWAEKIGAKIQTLIGEDADELQTKLVEDAKTDALYGSIIFRAKLGKFDEKTASSGIKALPSNLLLAFNSNGLNFISGEVDASKKILASFGYVDIERWGGTRKKFSLLLHDVETGSNCSLLVTKCNGTAMSNYLLEMIEAIMETS